MESDPDLPPLLEKRYREYPIFKWYDDEFDRLNIWQRVPFVHSVLIEIAEMNRRHYGGLGYEELLNKNFFFGENDDIESHGKIDISINLKFMQNICTDGVDEEIEYYQSEVFCSLGIDLTVFGVTYLDLSDALQLSKNRTSDPLPSIYLQRNRLVRETHCI